MDRVKVVILISVLSVAAISWLLSREQPDMMSAMMSYNPIAISLFTISWTIGMAAMMFPAITPMVLLYNKLISYGNSGTGSTSNIGDGEAVGMGVNPSQSSIFSGYRDEEHDNNTARQGKKLSLSSLSTFTNSINIVFFVGSYLLIWAITGIVLLLAWSIPVNYLFIHFGSGQQLQIVYGIVLVASGVYQFSSLKTKCLGYCESPLSFFMRRWSRGTIGALRMGMYHGLYCLGCCWPYFLIMIALGWMNLLWMALFAGIIFGEKIWSKGIRIARGAGIGFVIVGMMIIFGLIIVTPTGLNISNNHHNNINNNPNSQTGIQMHMNGMNKDMKISNIPNVSSPGGRATPMKMTGMSSGM